MTYLYSIKKVITINM